MTPVFMTGIAKKLMNLSLTYQPNLVGEIKQFDITLSMSNEGARIVVTAFSQTYGENYTNYIFSFYNEKEAESYVVKFEELLGVENGPSLDQFNKISI